MPDFDQIFATTKERPVRYKDLAIIRSDQFPVNNGDTLIASIEKANSDPRQGFSIDISGHCELDGKIFKQGKGVRMLFWADTAPKQIRLKVFTKRGFVRIDNIWEQTNHYLANGPQSSKSVEYWHGGAAMIVEDIENGRRYCCNDGAPDDDFDDIVFTITKEPG